MDTTMSIIKDTNVRNLYKCKKLLVYDAMEIETIICIDALAF
jgi:hypothetical protein